MDLVLTRAKWPITFTANAAAIEAGFRKRTIRVPDDADATIDALIRRFGVARIRAALARKT